MLASDRQDSRRVFREIAEPSLFDDADDVHDAGDEPAVELPLAAQRATTAEAEPFQSNVDPFQSYVEPLAHEDNTSLLMEDFEPDAPEMPATEFASEVARNKSAMIPIAVGTMVGVLIGFGVGYGLGSREPAASGAPAKTSAIVATPEAADDQGEQGRSRLEAEATERSTGVDVGDEALAPVPVPAPPPAVGGSGTPVSTASAANVGGQAVTRATGTPPAPAIGRLLVRSTPAGAAVFVEGRERGDDAAGAPGSAIRSVFGTCRAPRVPSVCAGRLVGGRSSCGLADLRVGIGRYGVRLVARWNHRFGLRTVATGRGQRLRRRSPRRHDAPLTIGSASWISSDLAGARGIRTMGFNGRDRGGPAQPRVGVARGRSVRAVLALENGVWFEGLAAGAPGSTVGEVVFNTSMTGYQEVLTDPSYAGQMVTMTCPEIGNYGVTTEDVESRAPRVAGFIMRDASPVASNWRSRETLREYLERHAVVAIADIDTRALTRTLRSGGRDARCDRYR